MKIFRVSNSCTVSYTGVVLLNRKQHGAMHEYSSSLHAHLVFSTLSEKRNLIQPPFLSSHDLASSCSGSEACAHPPEQNSAAASIHELWRGPRNTQHCRHYAGSLLWVKHYRSCRMTTTILGRVECFHETDTSRWDVRMQQASPNRSS